MALADHRERRPKTYVHLGAPDVPPSGWCAADTGGDALLDQLALVSGEHRQQLKQEPTVGRGAVDAGVTDGARVHAPPGQQVERIEEMREGAPEPIQFPDEEVPELPGLRDLHHRVETRARGGRPAHSFVDILGHEVEPTVAGDGAKLVDLEADVLAMETRA